ncbi:unnamed protein product [Mytilus edulis]|uniref:Uncharacterized protein n=1 Tax=Mytilus edulis TaxID=6550 RepID=A0A8S3UQB9_MYTED|nr:unnamed protein product [Mytilus edulis]
MLQEKGVGPTDICAGWLTTQTTDLQTTNPGPITTTTTTVDQPDVSTSAVVIMSVSFTSVYDVSKQILIVALVSILLVEVCQCVAFAIMYRKGYKAQIVTLTVDKTLPVDEGDRLEFTCSLTGYPKVVQYIKTQDTGPIVYWITIGGRTFNQNNITCEAQYDLTTGETQSVLQTITLEVRPKKTEETPTKGPLSNDGRTKTSNGTISKDRRTIQWTKAQTKQQLNRYTMMLNTDLQREITTHHAPLPSNLHCHYIIASKEAVPEYRTKTWNITVKLL